MAKVIRSVAGIAAVAGFNIGFIKILIFLYQQWGGWGIIAGLTFVPPIFICPIWEWIATGHWLTFALIYVLGFGGVAVCKVIED